MPSHHHPAPPPPPYSHPKLGRGRGGPVPRSINPSGAARAGVERAEEHSCILSYGQKSLKGEELSGRIDLVVYAQASPMQPGLHREILSQKTKTINSKN